MAKERTFGEFVRMANAGLTDEQVLSSSSMATMFSNIADFVTERYDRRCAIRIIKSGRDTAYTDGNNITIDINTSIVDGLELLDKVKYLIGMLYHETGHVLFTDFQCNAKCMKSLQDDGTLYPSPIGISADVDDVYNDFLTISSEKEIRDSLIGFWSKLQNCIEDGAIENFLRALFPGYAGCLNLVRERLYNMSQEIEMMPKAYACLELILQEATAHAHKGGLVGTCSAGGEAFDLTDLYNKIMPLIGQAVVERDSEQRTKIINAVYVLAVIEIADSIAEYKPNSSRAGKGGSSSDSSDSSDSDDMDDTSESSEGASGSDDESHDEEKKGGTYSVDSKKLSDILKHAAEEKHDGETVAPKGTTASVHIDDSEEKSEEEKKEEAEEKEEQLDEEVSKIKTEESKKEADTLAEEALKKELRSEIMSVSDCDSGPQKCVVVRESAKQDSVFVKKYRTEFAKPVAIAARLLAREIEDRKLGEIQHGKIYGKTIDPSSIYRVKGGKMMSCKNPEDRPDMAVMCLIDESGSMTTAKLNAARNTAMVIDGFCEKLSIPLSIYGHTEDFYGKHNVKMLSYKEFGFDGSGHTIERLHNISSRENNRDGTAIRFCTKKLSARDEQIKLMLIISDGQPSAYHYSGPSACRDVRKAVAEARKEGITVVTAGIGADREQIKAVYVAESIKAKDAAIYLDISNMDTLPQELVRIIKRNVRMIL